MSKPTVLSVFGREGHGRSETVVLVIPSGHGELHRRQRLAALAAAARDLAHHAAEISRLAPARAASPLRATRKAAASAPATIAALVARATELAAEAERVLATTYVGRDA